VIYGSRNCGFGGVRGVNDGRSWKRLIQKALRENEPEKLSDPVRASEGALFVRWQELRENEGLEERASMQAAADNLLAIKIHKLGWPNPRG
jgi:hypothetical protein